MDWNKYGVFKMIFQSHRNKIEREVEKLEEASKECKLSISEFEYYTILKSNLQTIKSLAEEVEKVINSLEKRGVIILNVKEVNDEMIRKSINPTNEEEKELLKEEYEIKISSAKIEERNKVCEEIKSKLSEVEIK
jgi:hypothetical protein